MLKTVILSLGIVAVHSIQALTIIGIAGGTSSGKTTLVKKLQEKFSGVITVIAQDDYYHDQSDVSLEVRRLLNFDHPDSINFALLKEHLLDFKQGKSVVKRNYSFSTLENLPGEQIDPTDIIIVDGILLFALCEIRDLFDIKIYIDTDDDVRLSRRLIRDHSCYGWSYESILHAWHATVKPMHSQFVLPSRQYADFIIDGNRDTNLAIELLSVLIQSKL